MESIHPTKCCRAPRAAFFDVLPGRAWVPSIDHYEAKAFGHAEAAFRSSSDPGEGTRAPGASWDSLGSTMQIGPGFAMSSATRTASFPEMRCCFILVSDSGRRHQREKSSTAQLVMDNRRHCLTHLLHKSPRIPQQLRNLAPARDCFSRIVSVLEGILVTLRGARGHPAVHPAAAVRHRR